MSDQNAQIVRKSGRIKIIEVTQDEIPYNDQEQQYQDKSSNLNQNDFGQVFQTNQQNTPQVSLQQQPSLEKQLKNEQQSEQLQIENPSFAFPDSQSQQINIKSQLSGAQNRLNSIQNQLSQKASSDINQTSLFDKINKDQLVEQGLPIKPETEEMITQQQEIQQTNSDSLSESTQDSSHIQSQIDNFQTNNLEVSELQYQLDDVVPDYFKLLVDSYLEKQTQNDFGKQFPSNSQKRNRYIKIVEVQNFEQLSKELLEIFPKLRYSYVCYVIPFLIAKDKCIEFLQNIQPILLKQRKAILNIKEVPITENTSTNLNQGKIKGKNQNQTDLSKTQQIKKNTSSESQSNQNKIQSQLIFNQCSGRLTLEEKQKAFEKNRLQIIELYKEKAQLIKNLSSVGVNEQILTSKIERIKIKIQQIIERGKELFVDLMIIKDQFCQIDFHKIFAAEIEGLLDAIFEKINIYKEENQGRVITLKIIVGKGNHSINGVPIIGPMTKQYIKTELQKDVIIEKGVILLQY